MTSSSLVLDLIEDHYAAVLKHPGHTAGFSQATAIPAENMPHLTGGTIAIIGQHVHQNGNSSRTIPFVIGFLITGPFQFSGALLDGAFHIVLGHVFGFGGGDCSTQSRVALWISSTYARRNGNFFDQFAEDFPTFGILSRFLMTYRAPLGMSRHEVPSLNLAVLTRIIL
jgi:hypothetical protein